MMLSYLEYISKRRDARGIVEVGLGDWLPVDCYHSHPTPLGLSCNILLYDACKKAEIMFDAIGLSHNARYAHDLGLEFREAARNTYINFDTMLLESECQTAQAMAIYYNLFNEDEKEKAFSQTQNQNPLVWLLLRWTNRHMKISWIRSRQCTAWPCNSKPS